MLADHEEVMMKYILCKLIGSWRGIGVKVKFVQTWVIRKNLHIDALL